MDDLTKRISKTQEEIIRILNESGLHPMILRLILEHTVYDLMNVMRNQQEEQDAVHD